MFRLVLELPHSTQQHWQSRIEIKLSRISIALLRSKSCSAEVPLRVELICTVWMHKYLTSLRSAMSSALNAVIQSKYTNGIMFNFYPGLPHTVQIYTEKHDHKFARYWSFAPVEYNNWFVAYLAYLK